MIRVLFISFVISLFTAPVCLSESVALFNNFHGQIYYSGMKVKLRTIDIDSYGWFTKRSEAKSYASQAGFFFLIGRGKPIKLSFNFFSNTSLIPLNRGLGKTRDVSLSSLSALFGYFNSWLPSLQYSQEIFRAIGVSDGTIILLKNKQVMQEYDTFNLGYKYETYMMIWSLDKFSTDKNKMVGDSFFHLGFGLVNFSFLSVKHLRIGQNWIPIYSEVEQEVSGIGFGIHVKVNFQDIFMINQIGFNFGIVSDISVVPKIGIGFIRGGYELGVNYKIANFFFINPSIGGYYWWIRNWSFDYSAINTDFGLMYGVKFRFQW